MPILIDIAFWLFFLFLSFITIEGSKRKFPLLNRGVLYALFCYHVLFTLIYSFFVPGDAGAYYRASQNHDASWFELYGTGVDFIDFLTYPFSHVLGLSYTSSFLFFSFLGFLGVILFYVIITESISAKKLSIRRLRIFPLILFLPSFHLWTVAIGKDPTIFFGIILFLYSLFNLKKRILLALIGLIIVFHIRPHIFAVLMISFAFALLFSSKSIKRTYKIALLVLLAGATFWAIPRIQQFVEIDSISLSNISDRIQLMPGYRKDVASYIDMSGYNPVFKMFTYVYRPLFVDAPGTFFYILSIDNLIFLILSLNLLRLKFWRWFITQGFIEKFAMFFFLLGVFIMSNGLSNFGIFQRQKMMFLPGLLLLIFGFLAQIRRQLRVECHQLRVAS